MTTRPVFIQPLMTFIFDDAKAAGLVKEEGRELLDGVEVESYVVTYNLMLDPMGGAVTLKKRVSDGEWVYMKRDRDA